MSNVLNIGGGSNPTGTIISFMGNNAPKGYLKCDGTVYNIALYPFLAEHFETEFGTKNYFGGDGETTFAVPDLRGEFLRGTGTNSHDNQGSGANVGVHQDGTSQPNFYTNDTLLHSYPGGGLTGTDNLDASIDGTGGRIDFTGSKRASMTFPKVYTSRPTNTSVLYCIKF